MSPRYKATDLLWATLAAAIPMAVVLLMQKPALRQEMVMRFWRAVGDTAQKQAYFWEDLTVKARDNYWKATL